VTAASLAVVYLDSLLPNRVRPRPAFRLADFAPFRILLFTFLAFALRTVLRFDFDFGMG
jgi:hypothetical protein